MKFFARRLVICILFFINSFAYGASDGGHYEVLELVSEEAAVDSNKAFWVGVHFKLEEGWHTYWENPGSAGLPVRIEWSLPAGFKASGIYWPFPERFNQADLVSYGYENEVLLLTKISPPALSAASNVELKAHVEYLICKESCIPGQVDLSLRLPIDKTGNNQQKSSAAPLFEGARKKLPKSYANWQITPVVKGKTLTLLIKQEDKALYELSGVYFFDQLSYVNPASKQVLMQENGKFSLIMELSDEGLEKFNEDLNAGKLGLKGVLVNPNGWVTGDKDSQAMSVDVEIPGLKNVASGVAETGIVKAENGNKESVGIKDKEIASSSLVSKMEGTKTEGLTKLSSSTVTLQEAILFAFIGGLILNLMPCIFPVISIKILGFIHQAKSQKNEIRIHGLLFTAGVLVSFWGLSGLLIALRASGEVIGWGYQLQSPVFISILAVVMLLIALNFAGVFEVGERAGGVGSKLLSLSGYKGSFFSGMLATIVATPCTAPFMGSAIGFALTLPAMSSLGVFTALAIGMSIPYLLLSFFPAMIKLLPKPGNWMATFKQAMTFPMLATVLWLLWVFGNQTNINSTIELAFALLIAAMSAWVYGKCCGLMETTTKRVMGMMVAGILFAMAVYVVSKSLPKGSEGRGAEERRVAGKTDSHNLNWLPYSADEVAKLREGGHIVYVDFTATWCLTCQANKALVFGSQEVLNLVKELDVKLVRGDWTSYDPVITEELQRHNRSGVPLTLIYPADLAAEPIQLPEILTPGIVLEAIRKATAIKKP